MDNRLDAFMRAVAGRGFRAALVSRPENIRYLTGYTGEGALLVGESAAVIVTDFRYVEQAEREAPGCACVRTTSERKLPACVAEQLAAWSLTALAIEPDYMTVSALGELKSALNGVAIEHLDGEVGQLRMVKSEDEIGAIARASQIACRAFDEMLHVIRPGMTEREVKTELNFRMLKLGAEAVAFDTIVAAGVNGSLPHATASDHALESGELVTLDFGAQVDGYKTDMTRTIAIGRPAPELEAMYMAVLEAQQLALTAVKGGAQARDVDGVARSFLNARYPGAFGHSLGHGVGLQIHEKPSLSMTSDAALAVGHVVTVEPGVYIPGLGGVRIEDTVVVTADGHTNLITAPKQLIIL